MKLPCVFIVTDSNNKELEVGSALDLAREIFRRKKSAREANEAEQILCKLVWYQSGPNIEAVQTEAKRIDSEPRETKLNLVRKMNPQWRDLYREII